MKYEKFTVALLYGGRGYEHDVSCKGAEYMLKLIDRSRYDVLPIYITKDGRWLAYADAAHEGFAALKNGVGGFSYGNSHTKIDCAIPLLHGDFGEDGVVQGTLQNACIPFVGCDCVCGATASDKVYTNAIADALGIPTPKWIVSDPDDTAESASASAEAHLSYPMFVKPARLGSSVGAETAHSKDSFIAAYNNARVVADRILIEEHVDIACELECAYYSAKGKEIFTKIGEICCDGGFYDYDNKYSDNSNARVISRASINEKIEKAILEYSARLCRILGIRHLSRFDFFLTRSGELLFNEINAFPGFTPSSLYPRLLSDVGISPTDAVNGFISDVIGV